MGFDLYTWPGSVDEYTYLLSLLSGRPQQAPPPNAEIPQQNMMQDPLNALQTLASQGNRNPQMMSMPGGPNAQQGKCKALMPMNL